MAYTQSNIETSALITIDTQNDFTLQGAPAEIIGTRKIIPNMRLLLNWYRDHSLPIVHIIRIYLANGSNVDLCRKEIIESGARIVCPGSEGVEIVSALKPDPSLKLNIGLLLEGGIQKWAGKEVVIYKPRWGAFYKTPLENHLRSGDIDTLVFCGCNFPNCPRTSIYEASERDFRLVLIEDAVSGLGDKDRTEMKNIGVELMTTDAFISQKTSK
jgi:nicotinamidase-related amidase